MSPPSHGNLPAPCRFTPWVLGLGEFFRLTAWGRGNLDAFSSYLIARKPLLVLRNCSGFCVRAQSNVQLNTPADTASKLSDHGLPLFWTILVSQAQWSKHRWARIWIVATPHCEDRLFATRKFKGRLSGWLQQILESMVLRVSAAGLASSQSCEAGWYGFLDMPTVT